jgi:hypothetical protein
VWESLKLHQCATAVTKFLEEQLVGYAAKTVLKTTILAGLMAAVALPAVLVRRVLLLLFCCVCVFRVGCVTATPSTPVAVREAARVRTILSFSSNHSS